MSKNLAIVGYRGFNDEIRFNKIMNSLNKKYNILENVENIVSGGAIGVDTLARNWAVSNEYKIIEIKPNYNKYGDKAPLILNEEIVEKSDVVIALLSPLSRGTLNTISHAKKQGKMLYIIHLNL